MSDAISGQTWGDRQQHEKPVEAGPMCTDCQLRMAA